MDGILVKNEPAPEQGAMSEVARARGVTRQTIWEMYHKGNADVVLEVWACSARIAREKARKIRLAKRLQKQVERSRAAIES